MEKYVDDKFFVKKYGIEKCKQREFRITNRRNGNGK